MTEIFSTVLNMSLTASVVIGVVLLLRLLLKGAPKACSYALWSVVLFRLLCPVSVESGLSILPDGLGYRPGEQAMEIYEAMEPGELPTAAYHAVGDVLNGGLGTVTVKVEPGHGAGEGSGYGSLMHPEVWFLVFSRLWPTGAALLAGYSLWSLFCLRRRLKKAVLLRDNIYRAEGIGTPFVLGVVRPKIYLPAGILEAEMPYIIRHEEYHIRRGDHIIKILAFAALCIHWFNPLVWLAFVLAGKDMEMSCDEAVLKQMGGDIRADYSQSLLALATGRRRFAATPLAFGEGDPKGRIKNVLKWKRPKRWVSILALLACVAGICTCAADPKMPEEHEIIADLRRGLSFEELEPGRTVYLNEDVVLAGEGSGVEWQVTYARTGLSLQVGLRAQNGKECVSSVEGGSGRGTFGSLDPGCYTPFVRNVDMGYDYEVNATGVVNFDLTSETDHFQKSTPWPQTDVPAEPVRLTAEEAIHQAVMEHHRSAYSDQYFCCENYVVLDIWAGTRFHPITGNDLPTMQYYLWVLYQEYLFAKNGIQDMGGAHIPTVVTLTENPDGSWSVLNYWEPRDGSYYVEDIRGIFPGAAAEEALHSQKYIIAQVQDCYSQAVEYAKTDSDVNMNVDAVIEGLFDEICADPLPSSNAYSYLEAHPIEYRELLYYGEYTRDYCERYLYGLGMEDGGPAEFGLREAIREVVLKELNS